MNLEAIDKEFVLNTYPRRYVNFKYGKNAILFDEDSKDYIDFSSGIGVVSAGHGNKEVSKAIKKQVKKIIHISNLFLIEPQAVLAKKIQELVGFDVGTFFSNSGAEANEGAIKLARKYGEVKFKEKKWKIITLEHSFHGRTITTVKATGQKSMHTPFFSPYPDGFAMAENIESLYNMLDDETVAVMIELVQGEGGVEPFAKEAVQKLAKDLKEREILLIVDEVQTGVFRSGEFLASQLYDIEPDIITLAKGLGNGVPIGAVITKHKDIFAVGDHGSTFGGNYLATSAAKATIKYLNNFKDSGLLDKNIIYFENKLKETLKEFSNIFTHDVGLGLMRGLRAVDGETQAKVIQKAFEKRVLVLKAGRNTVRFLPPLTITTDEIDLGFERLWYALREI